MRRVRCRIRRKANSTKKQVNIKQSYKQLFLISAVVFSLQQALQAQKTAKPAPLFVDKGKLVYTPDSLGNRIPDFSYCGYKASEQPIRNGPNIEIVVPAAKKIGHLVKYFHTNSTEPNKQRRLIFEKCHL